VVAYRAKVVVQISDYTIHKVCVYTYSKRVCVCVITSLCMGTVRFRGGGRAAARQRAPLAHMHSKPHQPPTTPCLYFGAFRTSPPVLAGPVSLASLLPPRSAATAYATAQLGATAYATAQLGATTYATAAESQM
jgi:hypothetical protein